MGLGRARGKLPGPQEHAAGARAARRAAHRRLRRRQRTERRRTAGNFPIRVVRASFPLVQAVSKQTVMSITVRNVGSQTAPNVALTVNSFSYKSSYPELADPERPTWVIEQGPGPIANPPVETQEVSPPGEHRPPTSHLGERPARPG